MKKNYNFIEIKNKKSLILLAIIIVSYFFVGKIISSVYMVFTGLELSDIQKNIVIWGIDFITIVLLVFLFRQFIVDSFFELRNKGIKNIIKWLFIGILLEILMAVSGYILMSIIVMKAGIDFLSFNQNAINAMINRNTIINFVDIVIIGPFLEEFFFRVFVFGILKNKNMILSIAISSVFFGLAHVIKEITSGEILIAAITMIIYCFSGAAFAILYAKRKNFFAPLLVHIIWNFMGFALNLVKGL